VLLSPELGATEILGIRADIRACDCICCAIELSRWTKDDGEVNGMKIHESKT
jgi:hypothetical protein